MKAVVFTTDAVFALIITAAAISLLLYFRYTPQTPLLLSYTKITSLLNYLTGVHVSSIGNSSVAARGIYWQGIGNNVTWPQFRANATKESSVNFAGVNPAMIYKVNSPYTVNLTVAGLGNVYFSTGNNIVAVNASSGLSLWNVSVGSVPESIAVYNNYLVYVNNGNLAALYGSTGASAWSISTGVNPLSPILVYNGQLIFSTTTNVIVSYYGAGGIKAWSTSPGFSPISLTVVNGSIAVRSSANGLGLISSANGLLLWYETGTADNTHMAGYGNLIAFGSGSNACAFYTDGSQDFCQTEASSVGGVTVYNGNLIYQTSNSVAELTTSGSAVWSKPLPIYGSGSGLMASSGPFVYSEWGTGNIIAENTASGRIAWTEFLPYGQIGSPMLAYGRLFVPEANSIVAFGGCYANSQSSALEAAISLYANGDGSCATSLLNGIYPASNFSVFANSSLLPNQRIAQFNGVNSFVITGTAGFPSGGSPRSQFAWVYDTNTLGLGYAFGYGSSGTGTRAALGVSTGGNVFFAGGADNNLSSLVVPSNTWTFIGYTYTTGSNSVTMYMNGQQQTGTFPTVLSTVIGSSEIGTLDAFTNFFQGQIADVQIYNSTLSGSQVSALYREGLGGGPVVPSNIVGWWPLDGDSNDYSGYNNTGFPGNVAYAYTGYVPTSYKNSFSISRATTVLPISVYAANFNGTSSYISENALLVNQANGGYNTVSFWMDWAGTANEMPISFYRNGALSYDMMFWTGTNCFGFNTGNSDDYGANSVPLANKWVYVTALLYNGAYTKNSMIYINGQQQTLSQCIGSGSSSTTGSSITIGSNNNVNFYFGGKLANFQLYNKSLSSGQITTLYTEGMAGLPLANSGLVAWWPLNGNGNDYSGHAVSGAAIKVNYTAVSSIYNTGVYAWR